MSQPKLSLASGGSGAYIAPRLCLCKSRFMDFLRDVRT
jgi:hypothetical protein